MVTILATNSQIMVTDSLAISALLTVLTLTSAMNTPAKVRGINLVRDPTKFLSEYNKVGYDLHGKVSGFHGFSPV